MSRLQLFQRLQSETPNNKYGFPLYLLRVDLIDPAYDSLDKDIQADMLDSAKIQLDYSQGFPAVAPPAAQEPIWNQLSYETASDFELFQQYLLQLRERGYRSLVELTASQNLLNPQQLQEIYHYNYWILRTKSFDLFYVARCRQIREQRILSCEDMHFLEADAIMQRLRNRRDVIFDNDKLDALEPDKAVKLLKDLIDIQRQALGLTSVGRGTKGDPDADGLIVPNIDILFRSIAARSGQQEQKVENMADSAKNGQVNFGALGEDAKKLLAEDPKVAMQVQELIMHLSVGKHIGTKGENTQEAIRNTHQEDTTGAPLLNKQLPLPTEVAESTQPKAGTNEEQRMTRDEEADLSMLGR